MATRSRRRARPYVETPDFLKMLARMMRAAAGRVGDGDVDELSDLVQLQKRLDQVVLDAVQGLRASGVTWDQIGEATGTTRQAAIQKWLVRK